MNPNNIFFYTLTAAGGTLNIDCSLGYDAVVIVGNASSLTMTSNFTLTASNQKIGETLKIFWLARANTITNATLVTILGSPVPVTFALPSGGYALPQLTISERYALPQLTITANYCNNGSGSNTWNLILSEALFIPSTAIQNNSITLAKLAPLLLGAQLIVTAADGSIVALPFTADGQILQYDISSNTFKANTISGAFTIDNAGVATLNPAILPPQSLTKTVQLSSAQILALQSAPVVVPLTMPNATTVNLYIYSQTTNPTTGDGTMTVFINYDIILTNTGYMPVVNYIIVEYNFGTVAYVFPATGLQIGYDTSTTIDVIAAVSQAQCQALASNNYKKTGIDVSYCTI